MGPHWKRWKRSFEFFLEAKGITKGSQQKALLLHCAGQDAEGDTLYAKAMRSLDAHLLPQVKEESETADQFVTRLFQFAENCNFGTAKEENIRDQLIDKCRSHDLRKKLLAVSGKLALQKVRDVARSMEAAERQGPSIEGDSKGENVNTLDGARGNSWKGKKRKLLSMRTRGIFRTRPGVHG